MTRASCHPDRPHEAKGLCAACYDRTYKSDPKVWEHRKERRRIVYRRDPTRFIEKSRNWRRTHYVRAMWFAARNRARKSGLDFSIVPEDINIPEICPLLGIRLEISTGRHKDKSPTLDRIDNRRGYVPNNIWIISYRANRIKNDASIEELEAVAIGLRRQLSQLSAASLPSDRTPRP